MAAPPDLRFTDGSRAALPVVLGYLSIGFAAGVVERAAGLSVAEVLLLSTVLYAGSAQFVLASMIASGNSGWAIVATVFFVNLRHLLLSAALAPSLAGLPAWKNALLGAQLTDETFVVAWSRVVRGGTISAGWLAGLNLSAWSAWGAANVAGALLGETLGNARTLGFDFALAAMFATLLVLQINAPALQGRGPAIALVAAACSIVVAAVGPDNTNVIAATLIAATLGLGMSAWKSARKS